MRRATDIKVALNKKHTLANGALTVELITMNLGIHALGIDNDQTLETALG